MDQEYRKSELNLDASDPLDQVIWQRVVIRHQHSPAWRPPMDVYELEDRLIILVEIGGMRDSDFQIVLQGRHLIISGVRRLAVAPEGVTCHQMEIRQGEFRADIYLPWDVQREQIAAAYRDGLLRIELPQSRRQQIQIINVTAEEGDSA